MAKYDKVRDAVGGYDFAELIAAKSLGTLEPESSVQIELSADKMMVSIVRPPLTSTAHKRDKVH